MIAVVLAIMDGSRGTLSEIFPDAHYQSVPTE